MSKIYLDNGSTSFPKAPGVGKAMADFIEKVGVNIGRGGYEEAYSAAEVVLDTREKLCRLFHFDRPENVIFQSGITAAMNVLLKGLLKPGDRVLTTSMEHNAVMRPLRQLEQKGVEVVQYLISRGADINAAIPETGSTPLHLAAGALEGCIAFRLFATLREAGADVSSRDNKGQTPLDVLRETLEDW